MSVERDVDMTLRELRAPIERLVRDRDEAWRTVRVLTEAVSEEAERRRTEWREAHVGERIAEYSQRAKAAEFAVSDVIERLDEALDGVNRTLSHYRNSNLSTSIRLEGKAEGIRLALDYLAEYNLKGQS